jgi:hypothetical protein
MRPWSLWIIHTPFSLKPVYWLGWTVNRGAICGLIIQYLNSSVNEHQW